MKTYSQFNEAISAARLAQLAAKGKGSAATAKMKADKLSSSQVASKPIQGKTKSLPGGTTKALPGDKGGALVRSSSKGTQITKKDTGKSGGLVRKTFTKPHLKSGGGYMTSPDGVGKPDKPRTLTEPTDGMKEKLDKKKKDDNKPKSREIKDPRSDDNSTLGRGEGDIDGKDKENSQI